MHVNYPNLAIFLRFEENIAITIFPLELPLFMLNSRICFQTDKYCEVTIYVFPMSFQQKIEKVWFKVVSIVSG